MSKGDLESALKSLLKSLRDTFGAPEPPPAPEDPTDEFVWSYLLWDSTAAKAEHALRRIEAGVTGLNELRVSLPHEICALLGERYPNVEERSIRLRASLDDIFRRENSVSLIHLKQLGKREARQYLDSIEAVPPFVAARVTLVALGGHAIPLDQRTLDLLVAEGLIEEGVSLDDAAAQLMRHIKAADALEAHLLLQSWAEEGESGRKRAKPISKKKASRKASTAKATTKKTTTRTKKKRVG